MASQVVSIIPEAMKTCSLCGEEKILEEFHLSRDGVLGRVSRCKDCIRIYQTKYSARPEVKIRKAIQARKNEKENKESRLQTRIKYYQKNKEQILQKNAVRDLGCSIEFLKEHLEKQFYSCPITGENMTWENYGVRGWHIDHIKPLTAFDLSDRKQFLEACNFTNLQPLWAEENIKKSNKIEILL